jgi:hypothetical protein
MGAQRKQTVQRLLLAAFFFVDFFVLLLALFVAVVDLPLPNAASQPSAYFLFVPTRTIVTVAYLF